MGGSPLSEGIERQDTMDPNMEGQSFTWDLTDLYQSPTEASWTDDLIRGVERARQFQASYRGADFSLLIPAAFFQALKEYESIQEEGIKPFLYASLLFSEDSQNSEYKTLL